MNKIFTQVYYSLLVATIVEWTLFFNNLTQQSVSEYIMFARFLNYISVPEWLHLTLFLSFFIFCVLCVLIPVVRFLSRFELYFKIITSILYLLILSIFFSYQKAVTPAYHIWMISSLIMCFYSSNRALTSKNNLFIGLRLNQTILLASYFISGLWKFREMLFSGFKFSFQDIILEHIAWSFPINKIKEPNFFLEILLSQPEILSFGLICVLIFQISCLIPVLLNRFFVFYGFLLILFHVSTGITLGVYFHPHWTAILFFLIIAEVMKKEEEKRLD